MTASKTLLGKRGGGHHNNGTNNINQTLNNIYNASSTTRNFNNGGVVLSSALLNAVVGNSNKDNNDGGSTSANGDYQFVINEIITSPTSSYKILTFLGKGTFGQVVKCWRMSSYGDDLLGRVETVALKILKCHPSYERQAQTEAAVLSRLASEGVAGRFNIVRPYEFFRHKGHACLVFENLDVNLYEYLKSRQFKPLQLEHIRVIAQQVLVALAKLKTFGLIHADLKPENIMLVDSVQKPFRVKVIDFGSACFASQGVCPTYLQSRYYRAPEILLGLPYSEAIDMWSLGCVLAELYMGWPLYPGSSEYDQIRFIVHTQGYPRAELLANATKAEQFFNKMPISVQPPENPRALRGANGNSKDCYWVLKSPEVAEREMGVKTKETRKYMLHSLRDMQMLGFTSTDIPPTEVNCHLADRACFVDLLETMLHMDSHVRCTPLEALDHPFITLSHLRNLGQSRLFVKSFLLLDTCTHLSPEELDEMPGRRRRLSPFHCLGIVDNLTNKNGSSSSSTGYDSRHLNPYNQLVLKFPQHLHSTQAQHVQYTVPPPPPAHQHRMNLQTSMHQHHHHHHLGPLVFTPVEDGSGVGTSQYNSRTHFNLPTRNSSACIHHHHHHHHQQSSALPHFDMNSLPYWDGSLSGAYRPEQQLLEQTPQPLNNLCNTFATVSNSSALAVQANKDFTKQSISRQPRGSLTSSCQRSLRLKGVAKNNSHSRPRLLQQHLQNSRQQHLPLDHQEHLKPFQVDVEVSSGLDIAVSCPNEKACFGQLYNNKSGPKNISPSVQESQKKEICQPLVNEGNRNNENVILKSQSISVDEIKGSIAEESSISTDHVVSHDVCSSPSSAQELTKLQDGGLVCSLKNLCLVRLDGTKKNPEGLLNGKVEVLDVLTTSGRDEGGDAGDSVSSRDVELPREKMSISDSKQERVPINGAIKLNQPQSAISSAASPLVVVPIVPSKSHRTKAAKTTRFINQEPPRSQLNSNLRFNQPAIPSSTVTTQLLPSDVSVAADPAGANLTNQHLSVMPPYHPLNQSAFLMYPSQQQQQQQDQNQLLNQPGFIFYPPQQQQSQHFNQPIFNLPPPLQPGRPILAQQHSGSFILFPGLITPEGSPMGHLSPSFYSLNFGGGFIPASNPGMHCGFYALGSPLLGMGNPHLHSHYQPNHQPLQYLYQA